MSTNEVSVDSRKTISMRSVIVVLAGLAVLAVLFAALSGGRPDEKDRDEPLWTVARGPLTISVTEAGRIQNKDEIIVRNETDCSLKILSLTEEGTVVKKGDIIISLDDADLESGRDSAALDVRRLESDLMAATERREILKSQMQSNVQKAELDLKFARLDLERVTLGVHPQSLEAADANITMAEEDLERAEEDYAWSTKLRENGFKTLK
jgi:HlyD family secretion protein